LKIAIIARDYHSRGGLERVSQFYARHLRDRGHEVHVWYGNGTISELDQGLRFHRVNTGLKSGWLYCAIFAALVSFRIKAALYDSVILIGAAGVCRGSTIVANSVHREWFLHSLAQLPVFSLKRVLKTFNPLHYVIIAIEYLQYRTGRYRSIIAVSEPIKRELTKHYGIPPSKISLLPNGTNCRPRDTDLREAVRGQLDVGGDQFLLCMLVNELERKGVRQAMAAVAALREYPLRLLVVTKVDLRQVIKLAQQFGILDRVIARAATPDAQGYLFASDLYILPTQYEAWNLSIMEAAAAGLPVITTKLDQADRIVTDGESGYLLMDPLDVDEVTAAVSKWIAVTPEEKLRMSAKSQESVRPYSWDAIVRQLESIVTNDNEAQVAVTR
jgi:UDP-glucose:(heptosyl)LPS alpha-1,3-glucosyltransferase